MSQPEIKILISGGGTGGHIFPAIAIADALRKAVPACKILFVGASGKMEMEKIPQAGYPIEALWISGFQRSFSLKNLSFPFKLISSMLKAHRIIRNFRPDVVVGVGGFASGPTLKVAASQDIPIVIQEQNSFPGVTNKLIARQADRICVAYDGLERWFPAEKIVKTGNPVRENVVNIMGKYDEAFEYFGLKKGKPVLLIVGGSQGSLSINQSLVHHLAAFAEKGLQLIWQTGKLFAEKAKSAIQINVPSEDQQNFHVHDFITRMDLAYAAADIVISRAGAIAISELSAVGKPCILIPLPSAAEDHQTKNAQALADKQAAILLKDSDAAEQLGTIVADLANNNEKRQRLAQNIVQFAITGSADRIAGEIIKLIQQKNGF